VAEILKKKVRGGMAFRYGGEEMAILLPKAPAEGAEAVAERLRKAVEAHKIGGVKVTASFGVAELDGTLRTGDELVEKADQALYKAKEGGRNRVVVAAKTSSLPVETRRWARGA
jgi:diguanylate cyclase (GGDEF)-like protein